MVEDAKNVKSVDGALKAADNAEKLLEANKEKAEALGEMGGFGVDEEGEVDEEVAEGEEVVEEAGDEEVALDEEEEEVE